MGQLKTWFEGAHHPDFFKSQTPEHTLLHMALTVKVGDMHPESLKGSCHKEVAMYIREQGEDLFSNENCKIVILGQGKRVFHSIVIKDGQIVADTLNNSGRYSYDDEAKKYYPDDEPDNEYALDVMAEKTMPEFKTQYLDKINMPAAQSGIPEHKK